MNSPDQQRALAFGAHPDDVEIYCLGLLLKLQQEGWNVGWVVATDGLAGLPKGMPVGTRRQEALDSGNLVGVIPNLIGLEDGRLGDDPRTLDLIRATIADFKPHLIISPSPNDYHPDHRALSRLVNSACPIRTALIEMDTMMGVDFNPDLSIDITSVFQQKLSCLRRHVTQEPDKFMDKLNTWSSFRAIQTAQLNVFHAESYRVNRTYGRVSPLFMLAEHVL